MSQENNRPHMHGDEYLPYSKIPNWLMQRPELSSNDKIIYARLRSAGMKSDQYWASQDYLAHECGFSVDSVQRSLRNLEKFGLISRKRNGKKMYNSYFFHIHEWMDDYKIFNKDEKSDTANTRITQSDTANTRMVIPQIRGSIFKDKKENKSKYICSNVHEENKNDFISTLHGVHPSAEDTHLETKIKLCSTGVERPTSSKKLSKEETMECLEWFQNEFWPLYPNKKKKKTATESWLKVMAGECKNDRVVLKGLVLRVLGNFIAHDPSWKEQGGKFIPLAENWLQDERWTDELMPPSLVLNKKNTKKTPEEKKAEEERVRLEAKKSFEKSLAENNPEEYKKYLHRVENINSNQPVVFRGMFKSP